MELKLLDITSLLYLDSLTDAEINRINSYISEYFEALDNYQINPNNENTQKLYTLSKPLHEVFLVNNPRIFPGRVYPAIELIKNSIDEYGRKIEKEFENQGITNGYVRKLSANYNSQGHALTEDFDKKANAFWQAPLIIGISLILGIILATLLIFIK